MSKNLPVTGTYSSIHQTEILKLRGLLAIASILFVTGIFTPMFTLTKFIVIKNSFSVFSGAVELLQNGQIVLFIVVFGFSIILPVLKIVLLFRLLSLKPVQNLQINQLLKLMHEYGRWAMLDVMVVAVLIMTVKLGAIASIKIHFGLYLFGAAVLLIMLITNRVVHLTQKSLDMDIKSTKNREETD